MSAISTRVITIGIAPCAELANPSTIRRYIVCAVEITRSVECKGVRMRVDGWNPASSALFTSIVTLAAARGRRYDY
jgi:hypothetical protein